VFRQRHGEETFAGNQTGREQREQKCTRCSAAVHQLVIGRLRLRLVPRGLRGFPLKGPRLPRRQTAAISRRIPQQKHMW
jgi:hypothetical protein